jgi:hypothetical protein
MASNAQEGFMKLRFHSHAPAPYGAGPTPPRTDGKAKKLATRIRDWENRGSTVHEHHKPGSLK